MRRRIMQAKACTHQRAKSCKATLCFCPTLDEGKWEELCYNATYKERKRRLPVMIEPYSAIHPCEEMPFAKEIYERYQMLSEIAWSSDDKGMKQYLLEHRLWLTYGWYMELLTKERSMQDERALVVIGQFYGEKENDRALMDSFAGILNRYWQVLWGKGKQQMLAGLRETAPVVYEYFWKKMEPSYISDSIGIIMADGLHDEHLQNFLKSNKECLDSAYFELLRYFPVNRWNRLEGSGIKRLKNWLDFFTELVKDLPDKRQSYKDGLQTFTEKVCYIEWRGISKDRKSGKNIKRLLDKKVLEMEKSVRRNEDKDESSRTTTIFI